MEKHCDSDTGSKRQNESSAGQEQSNIWATYVKTQVLNDPPFVQTARTQQGTNVGLLKHQIYI